MILTQPTTNAPALGDIIYRISEVSAGETIDIKIYCNAALLATKRLKGDTQYEVNVAPYFVRDSIIVLARGDTVFIHRDRWRDRIHTLHDTVVRTDSIPYPVEVVRSEKRIPRLYRWSLWVAIGALLLLIKKLVL